MAALAQTASGKNRSPRLDEAATLGVCFGEPSPTTRPPATACDGPLQQPIRQTIDATGHGSAVSSPLHPGPTAAGQICARASRAWSRPTTCPTCHHAPAVPQPSSEKRTISSPSDAPDAPPDNRASDRYPAVRVKVRQAWFPPLLTCYAPISLPSPNRLRPISFSPDARPNSCQTRPDVP